jgi:hypothetical protein
VLVAALGMDSRGPTTRPSQSCCFPLFGIRLARIHYKRVSGASDPSRESNLHQLMRPILLDLNYPWAPDKKRGSGILILSVGRLLLGTIVLL